MADGVEFSITGLESLLGKLDSVSYDVRRKGGRAALRKAAQVVVQKAKEGAERIDDKATGRSISDNIALRWNGRLFKQTGDLGFRIRRSCGQAHRCTHYRYDRHPKPGHAEMDGSQHHHPRKRRQPVPAGDH